MRFLKFLIPLCVLRVMLLQLDMVKGSFLHEEFMENAYKPKKWLFQTVKHSFRLKITLKSALPKPFWQRRKAQETWGFDVAKVILVTWQLSEFIKRCRETVECQIVASVDSYDIKWQFKTFKFNSYDMSQRGW